MEGQADLELKELPYFTGTMGYSDLLGAKITDGVRYIMENGYSWFVTDMLVILRMQFREDEFCCIKLYVAEDSQARAVITDGNENVLYEQSYEYTDAKKDVTMYYTNNVLMLSSEY